METLRSHLLRPDVKLKLILTMIPKIRVKRKELSNYIIKKAGSIYCRPSKPYERLYKWNDQQCNDVDDLDHRV
ncbi:MAG: hypothetical protein C0408_08915, partial [Odoribacter sp.]|nr:hypothetical protein [Odoribacter sp.]